MSRCLGRTRWFRSEFLGLLLLLSACASEPGIDTNGTESSSSIHSSETASSSMAQPNDSSAPAPGVTEPQSPARTSPAPGTTPTSTETQGGASGVESGGTTSAGGTLAEPTTPGDAGALGGSAPGGGAAPVSEPNAGAGGTGPIVEPTDGTVDPAQSQSALDALREWLALSRAERPALATEPFASVPLTAVDTTTAKDLLWDDHRDLLLEERQSEVEGKTIVIGDFSLRYDTVLLGEEPTDGRSLFISMHGGGSAPPETNDEQWQNQIALAQSYAPEDALWIAPRAPTDDWNMWFKDHIDVLFDRLITNMIAFEGINPNRVYLTGYSAGGDGVYQLGPRLADRWAAAAMSAGHPNDASPLNLRNIGFAVHVGGDDTAFSRNEVALEWGAQLEDLQAVDGDGYAHQVEVHPGLPHWMNLADQVSIPFLQSFERNLSPSRVVWLQSSITGNRFYWLAVSDEDAAQGTQIVATTSGQTIDVETEGVAGVTLRLSDALLDMDAVVTISVNGTVQFEGAVTRTIGVVHETLLEREDPEAAYSGEVFVEAP